LLLLAAARVDAVENHLESFVTLRPDNPLTETGIRSEFTHNGWKARAGTTNRQLSHVD